jgi:hypothetical protein
MNPTRELLDIQNRIGEIIKALPSAQPPPKQWGDNLDSQHLNADSPKKSAPAQPGLDAVIRERDAALKVCAEYHRRLEMAISTVQSLASMDELSASLKYAADQMEWLKSHQPPYGPLVVEVMEKIEPPTGSVEELAKHFHQVICHTEHGVERIAREVLDRDARWKHEMSMRVRKDQGEFWCWQGDSEDHIESLTCPVLIDASQFRDILARVNAAEAIVNPLNELRQVEGVVVHLFCDKPDFGTGAESAVEICDRRFNWVGKRFKGATLDAALQEAVKATRTPEGTI